MRRLRASGRVSTICPLASCTALTPFPVQMVTLSGSGGSWERGKGLCGYSSHAIFVVHRIFSRGFRLTAELGDSTEKSSLPHADPHPTPTRRDQCHH